MSAGTFVTGVDLADPVNLRPQPIDDKPKTTERASMPLVQKTLSQKTIKTMVQFNKVQPVQQAPSTERKVLPRLVLLLKTHVRVIASQIGSSIHNEAFNNGN